MLAPDELSAFHALNLQVGSDYRKLFLLREKFRSWSGAALELGVPQSKLEKAAAELSAWSPSIELVLRENNKFPALLREIPNPPHAIYVRGQLPPPESVVVAIVGTRRPTPTGLNLSYTLGRDLAAAGCVIVSGLAFGADAAAHEGCLAGGGQAIAVLASGVDNITPRSNAGLGEKILATGGTIISEYPPGAKIFNYNFLKRNRIVSGLARAVIIVEAPARSGSLATARFALDQNRDILVVPGPAGHRNFVVSHRLIRDGARLIENAADVLEDLNLKPANPANILPSLNGPEKDIYEAIALLGTSCSVDKICTIVKLDIQTVNQTVAMLVLKGYIKEYANGYGI